MLLGAPSSFHDLKYSNRTVTLMQHLKRHSVYLYTAEIIITSNFRGYNSQNFPGENREILINAETTKLKSAH